MRRKKSIGRARDLADIKDVKPKGVRLHVGSPKKRAPKPKSRRVSILKGRGAKHRGTRLMGL
jgi:hypothetical protein